MVLSDIRKPLRTSIWPSLGKALALSMTNDNDADAYLGRGCSYNFMKRYQEAIEDSD
jgi:hypothetical protein